MNFRSWFGSDIRDVFRTAVIRHAAESLRLSGKSAENMTKELGKMFPDSEAIIAEAVLEIESEEKKMEEMKDLAKEAYEETKAIHDFNMENLSLANELNMQAVRNASNISRQIREDIRQGIKEVLE
ncbi:MAG: hypothetical protein U0L49_08670 [Eubacterium sp.]|nr:hypothetical protein [Eubacterium sp.]